MDIAFHEKLKDSFIQIRHIASSSKMDSNNLDAVLGDIRFCRKQIEKKSPKKERQILLYCIDTLLCIVDEGNRQKLYDFADTVHNIPEIFMGKRNFYSFRKEISAFRGKYGKDYFSKLNKIYPYFTSKAPKNALSFFSPKSDEDFKKQHPTGYWILVISGIIAFILPLLFLTVYLFSFEADQDQAANACFFPAIIGCFVMGVGLFNIVAAFIHQYLGHKLTVVCLLGGGCIVFGSMYMMSNPQLYDEAVINFYFISLILQLLPALFYFLFRSSVSTWLQRSKHISRSKSNKFKKGIKNFWWYQALHEEVNLGAIYYMNKAFTILWPFLFVFTLLTGYVKVMSLVLVPLHILLYLLTGCMVAFSNVQDKLELYGKPVVLFRIQPFSKRVDSSIFDVFWVVFMVTMGYVILMMAGKIWGISLPHL